MKYYLLLLFPLFISCEDTVTITETDFVEISYSFHDASVPPQYHRSYTIGVTPKEVNIQVDSYGDILAHEQFNLAATDLNKLIETINSAQLKSGTSEGDSRCVGGTSENLAIKKVTGENYSCAMNHCGGAEVPESLGRVEDVIQAIKALVPNLSDLLE